MSEKIIIPNIDIINDFSNHLSVENNNRILFSGKFGIGKIFFLNEFFKAKKEEYEVFHLFPINYQINTNDDIIEILKYDILIELLKKDKNIFKKNNLTDFLSVNILVYLFGSFNANDIISNILSYFPKVGRQFQDSFNLYQKFLEFKEQMKKGEKGIIEEFIKNMKVKTETDPLSELIKTKIISLKGNKKSVLILDDLDRIDPEHIFRLLNIFGAHFDSSNGELPNKFGFDKIVLVGDYNNIKSIFHHKYGYETDFQGYIDKFFNIEPYWFNNDKMIYSLISKIISNFKVNSNFSETIGNNGYINVYVSLILKKAIILEGKNKLNLRELLKLNNYQIDDFNVSINNYSKDYDVFITKMIIKVLLSIFSGKTRLISVLEDIKKNGKKKDFNKDDDYYEKDKYYHNFAYRIVYLYLVEKYGKGEVRNKITEEISIEQYKIKLNTDNYKIEQLGDAKIQDFLCDVLIFYVKNYI